MKKHLIIIPGIGDDNFIYRIAAVVFRIFGFDTHIYVFGWDDKDAENYSQKYVAFTEMLQNLEGSRYLLGVSAGGTLACTVGLLSPSLVNKAVTLCSPLTSYKTPINPLLEVAIWQNESQLQHYKPYVSNIISLHAIRDEVVPLKLSQPPQLQTHSMPSFFHIPSIVFGLTLYAPMVAHFLKQR